MFRHDLLEKFAGLIVAAALLAACGGHTVTPQLSTDSGVQSPPISSTNAVPQNGESVNVTTPEAVLSPASLSFRAYGGSQSAPQNVVLSNPGTATLKISSIVISKVTSTCYWCGFSASNNCGTQLSAGTKCTIAISFWARSSGSLQSKLLVSDNGGGSPQTASLYGYGASVCVQKGGECYSGHRCCPGLVCVAFSTRAYCEPTLAGQSYLRRAVSRDVGPSNQDDRLNMGNISVIDTAQRAVTGTIAVGSDPVSVAITPDGKKLYVANASTDSLSVVDTNRNMVVKTIAAGFGIRPVDVAISANGRSAYVMGSRNGTVSVINTASDTVIGTTGAASLWRTIAILRRCAPGVVASPDGRVAYVVNASSSAEAPMPPFENLADVLYGENMVLQKGIANPLPRRL